ncbi:MAG: RND transporter [Ignavibacteriae bacterium]|nr:MAG: RND transporter [Ignavibacteriota bacterium]
MNKQKYIVIGVGIAIVLFAFLVMNILSGFKSEPKRVKEKEVLRSVKAAPVKYSKLKGKIISSGRVTSKSELFITAEVPGKIIKGNVPFKKGQSFSKGDLLLKIYDKEAGLKLKSSKSKFLNSLAGILPDLKIDFPDSYNNWYIFFENIDIEKDLPELPKINSTKEKVFLASRNLLSSYYDIKSLESNFKKYSIYAPFTGAITSVNVEVGGIAGMNMKLGSIINTQQYELEVPLNVKNDKWVKRGDEVVIKNNLETETWKGRVIRKSSNLDVKTQSLSVFVQIYNNQKTPIYKGEYLKAYFNSLQVNDAMEIPRNAVFNTNEVFVVRDNLLAKEKINIIKVNENSIFFNGLKEKTLIVIEPLVNARENTKVKVI